MKLHRFFISCLILHQLNTKPNTIKSHKIQGTKLMQLQHFMSWNKANIKHSCKSQLYILGAWILPNFDHLRLFPHSLVQIEQNSSDMSHDSHYSQVIFSNEGPYPNLQLYYFWDDLDSFLTMVSLK